MMGVVVAEILDGRGDRIDVPMANVRMMLSNSRILARMLLLMMLLLMML